MMILRFAMMLGDPLDLAGIQPFSKHLEPVSGAVLANVVLFSDNSQLDDGQLKVCR
jgi:hypothetical protein